MITINRTPGSAITYGQMNLIFRTRTLWRDLVMWSRIYLFSKMTGSGDAEDVFKRLYKIPIEFGNMIQIIFGNQAAETIVQQLSHTLVLYRELVDMMIAGNTAAVNEIVQELYRNGNERAAYMASINPFWNEAQWKALIFTFYKYSFDEITSILTNDPKNIDIYDRFLQFADIMGDHFAQGLFQYLTLQTTK